MSDHAGNAPPAWRHPAEPNVRQAKRTGYPRLLARVRRTSSSLRPLRAM